MEFLLGFGLIVLVLVALDLAALRWGANSRHATWWRGGYDPRDDWHSRKDI